MLKDHELERLFVQLGTSEAGRTLVRTARANSPVREVSSRLGNTLVTLFSQKMDGRKLELESRTVEDAVAEIYENDPGCLEYWPQPVRLDLVPKDKTGREITRRTHTPDFLRIGTEGITLDEWREESRLIRLQSEGDQFYKDTDARWHFRAAEEHLAEIGIKYALHSAFELPTTLINNIRFLKDYRLSACSALPDEVVTRLKSIIAENGTVYYLALLQDHGFTADQVLKAIADRIVAADLQNDRLDMPQDLMIHRDMAVARIYRKTRDDKVPALPIPGMGHLIAGSTLKYDGKTFEVLLVGGGQVLLRDSNGQRSTLQLADVESLHARGDLDIQTRPGAAASIGKTLANFSHEEVERARRRLEAVEAENDSVTSTRTLQRWKARIEGKDSTLDKVISLVGDDANKGNRLSRLPEKVETLADDAIKKFYNTPEGRTCKAIYLKYEISCDEAGVTPMSYPTFTLRTKGKGSPLAREGKRKVYQEAPIPLYLDYASPANGSYPHEICYLDHTILTLATTGPGGGDLGKPTFSLGTDGHTTQARAMYLSYDPPGAKAVLMVLRDYVRRHGRLPKVLVVDGGKEFRSKSLEQFCSIYGIQLRYRSPGKPRAGSSVERALGSSESEVIAQMEGNTRIMRNVRMVTKSVNPFPRAAWTLTAAYRALEEYLFTIRNERRHPTLGMTPQQYHDMRMRETGNREHLLVRFDEDLMLLTSSFTHRSLHVIDRQRGVWVDNMYYWHDELRSAKPREHVEVRIEPWNACVIYVYFRNHWIAAIARDTRALAGRTRYETEMAFRAERRVAKINGNKDRLSKETAQKMVKLWSPENFDERIGKQQREMEHLYTRLGMTVAMLHPTTAPTGTAQPAAHDNKDAPLAVGELAPTDTSEPANDADMDQSTGDAAFWESNSEFI